MLFPMASAIPAGGTLPIDYILLLIIIMIIIIMMMMIK